MGITATNICGEICIPLWFIKIICGEIFHNKVFGKIIYFVKTGTKIFMNLTYKNQFAIATRACCILHDNYGSFAYTIA